MYNIRQKIEFLCLWHYNDEANKHQVLTNEQRHEKNLFMPYANNKGADQPAHPMVFAFKWTLNFPGRLYFLFQLVRMKTNNWIFVNLQSGILVWYIQSLPLFVFISTRFILKSLYQQASWTFCLCVLNNVFKWQLIFQTDMFFFLCL